MKKSIFSLMILLGLCSAAAEQEQTRVQEYVSRLDNFLTPEDIEAEANRSQLILGQRLIWSEGGEWDYRPYVDLKLHLPKLAKHWLLRFTSFDEDDEETGINSTQINNQQLEENVGLSLFFLEKVEKVKVAFRPRIDEDGTSYLLRFQRPSDFWILDFKPRLEFFAEPVEGTGQFLALNLGYKINTDWYFMLINEEQYSDLGNILSANQGFRLRQIINEDMTQHYSIIYESNNQPHFRLAQYTLSTQFEHYVYDRSMVYRLIPNITYERENSFRGNPSMTFELDFIF